MGSPPGGTRQRCWSRLAAPRPRPDPAPPGTAQRPVAERRDRPPHRPDPAPPGTAQRPVAERRDRPPHRPDVLREGRCAALGRCVLREGRCAAAKRGQVCPSGGQVCRGASLWAPVPHSVRGAARRLRQRSPHSRTTRRARHRLHSARQPGQVQRDVRRPAFRPQQNELAFSNSRHRSAYNLRSLSFVIRRPTPARFDLRHTPLRLETSRPLGLRRPSRLSHLRLQHCPADQTDKAVHRVSAVSFLAAEPASFDDQHPLVREPLPGKKHQPLTYILRKGIRSPDIEPKLDGRGDLVHVLPTGAGSPEEPKVDLAFRDADGAADSDHVGKETACRASAETADMQAAQRPRASRHLHPLALRWRCAPGGAV